MDAITLVPPAKQHEAAALEYVQEHLATGEQHLHGASGLSKMSYGDWLAHLHNLSSLDTAGDWVVSSTRFAVDKTSGKIVGVIDIRHYLNDFLANYGGHIGYGVRPSERRKGYATEILRRGLVLCGTIGLDKVMLTCDKDNIASAKTITKHGGVLERESLHTDGKAVQVYWITL